MAKEKAKGGTATKGEVATAAKMDVKQAVETWAKTKGLPDPVVPPGMDPEKVKTTYRLGVMMRQLIQNPDTRKNMVLQIREINRAELENRYRSDWLARRIVDLPAQDATREWRQWAAR
jgi:hypothetical protein